MLATKALAKAETYLSERIHSIDSMVARLRKKGVDDIELLGETLKSLRLAKVDAGAVKVRKLEALGLMPVGLGDHLRTGSWSVVMSAQGQGDDAH